MWKYICRSMLERLPPRWIALTLWPRRALFVETIQESDAKQDIRSHSQETVACIITRITMPEQQRGPCSLQEEGCYVVPSTAETNFSRYSTRAQRISQSESCPHLGDSGGKRGNHDASLPENNFQTCAEARERSLLDVRNRPMGRRIWRAGGV